MLSFTRRRVDAPPRRPIPAGLLILSLIACLGSAHAASPSAPAHTEDDGTWALFPPPSPRGGHTLVLDTRRHRMILFGGNLLGDVWTLSLEGRPRWRQLVAQGPAPGPRSGHTAIYDPAGDRMIVYGGNDNRSNFPVGSVWALALSGTPAWSDITPAGTAPAARGNHGAVYDPVGRRMLVFAGLGDFSSSLSDVWALSLTGTPSWTQVLAEDSPAGRVAGGFLDEPRGRAIAAMTDHSERLTCFQLPLGGTPAWSPLATASDGPGPRRGACLAFDPVQDRLVSFGGEYGGTFNDVWQLRFGTTNDWSRLSPAGESPPPQSGTRALFDPASTRMILFGGSFDCCGTRNNGVWALGLGVTPAWVAMLPGDAPPGGRSWHTAVYDALRSRATLFAGFSGSSSCCNDTWTFTGADTGAWRQLATAGALPDQRYLHTAIHDAAGDRMIVFGGRAGPALADAWALSLADPPTWTRLTPAGASPGGRYSHTAIYDPVRRRMLVFGGFSSSTFRDENDVWALSLTGAPAWTKLEPLGAPPFPRERHTAIYDPTGDRMIVFGGQFGPPLADAWALSLSGTPRWTQLTPAPGEAVPAARMDHVAVYDADRRRMIVYGGLGSGNRLFDDTWAFSLGATPRWTRLAPDGFAPGPALDQAAVYDPVKQRMWMFFAHDVEPGALRPWQLLFRSLNAPPECGAARAVPAVLGEANHRLVPIAIDGVTDPDGDPVSVTVTRVTQDEPLDDAGDGRTCPDAVITEFGAEVRAERAGTGDGRVYRIEFTATDPAGEACAGSVTVTVPHNRGGDPGAGSPGELAETPELTPGQLRERSQRDSGSRGGADDGQGYVSTGPCAPRGRAADEAGDPPAAGTAPSLGVRTAEQGSVWIEWSLPSPGPLRIGVYDVAGRHVRTLLDGPAAAGARRLRWETDGLHTGVYFCRLETAQARLTRAVFVR